HGPRPAFAGARADQITLELGQPPQNGKHQSRPCDVVVSAHVSPRDLKPAFLAVIAASVFNRSRVDRARRSSLVTVSTSPASSTSSNRRSCARSVFAPLATSRNTFLHPALVSWRTWASTLWPSVDTLA